MKKRYQGALLLISAYAAIAPSPIQEAIGRQRPDLAGLFSPPFFNFSAVYKDGRVLGFAVGTSRQELFQQIRRTFTGTGEIIRNCVVRGRGPLVSIQADTPIESVYGGPDRLCVFTPGASGGRMIVTFLFQVDSVSSVEIRYNRTEGI